MLNDFAAEYYNDENHPMARQKYALGNYNASLIRTVRGKMITINHDTSTPHPREPYRIQGTRGVYLGDSVSRTIYIEGLSPGEHRWEPAEKYLKEYEHPIVKNYNPPPRRGGSIKGHGGGQKQTPMIWYRLVNALRENKMPDWDVYDSVTSGSIAPISEMSVAQKSRDIEFPDFTRGKWATRSRITLA